MKREIEGKAFCGTMLKCIKVLKKGPWCLIGGRAVEFYINPPQTPDADVLCDASGYDVRKLIKEFKTIGVTQREEYEDGYIAFLFDNDSGIELDIMPTYDEFEIEAISSAKKMRCDKATFPVIKVEDLVIMKAVAACSPGSGMMGRSPEKKHRDARAIYHLNKENELDRKYIARVLGRESMTCETTLLKRLKVIE